MRCDSCQQKPASIFLEKDINGHKSTRHLCQTCYQKEQGSTDPFQLLHDVFAQSPQGALLKTLLNPSGNQSMAARPRKSLICPECGTSWEDFRQSGLFGCAICYDTFADALPDLARKLHGQSAHIGAGPQEKMDERMLSKGNLSSESSELDRLKARLKEAVADEAYEEAAHLRDRILELEKEEEDAQ